MLSLVIPALNAERTLPATLDAALAPGIEGVEIVVADGGSQDATRTIAQAKGARVITCERGRGRQLAEGASAASHDWLLFLHADTRLPDGWWSVVERFRAQDSNVERAGYFRLAFDDHDRGARRVARLANWRARTFGLPYGDQGLLVHKTLYDDVGGYDATLALMEDVELVRRLGPMRLVELAATVVTAADKYRQGGWWARPARNLACLALHLLGLPRHWVQRLYA